MAAKKACGDAPKRSRSPMVLEAEMFAEFQDWCLRTYGDSGKTKTVTRRKYNKIMQTLLQSDESDGVYVDNSHINAKFKFWVKSKGFTVGTNVLGEHNKRGGPGKPVLYVPVKSTGADGGSGADSSLKRVAVVEDFFDIIYAMHVEMGSDPGRAPKHAGQKKTYKAIAETYAFLPREAVTRFLMSCGECQKRMHISPSTQEFKENDRPTSLVADIIDYNMPLTATYLKQMKLQCMTATERDDSSISSEEVNSSETAWVPARPPAAPTAPGPCPQNGVSEGPAVKDEDDEEMSESSSPNGQVAVAANATEDAAPPTTSPAVTTPSEAAVPSGQVTENGASTPLDFSSTWSSSSSDDQQPINLMHAGSLSPQAVDPGRKLSKSPPYSTGSYDSVKMELSIGGEDVTSDRTLIVDDDDDDHDDHDDSDKIIDVEGADPERLKAFNMFVRLFVDENLDRMVPISKQPKEKIQAIMESCGRQFPEFQERSRKRIRTYLKSCRRMKKGGFEIRPTPPHLTSAMAENILAAACESETRNAAKRMRLDVSPSRDESTDNPASRDPAPVTPTAFAISSAAFASEQLYTNGGLSYTLRGYTAVAGGNQQNNNAQTNGPTDLSMKSTSPNSASSSNNHGQGGGGGGASAQLSPPEVTAVRQLIAGYRESAAFLLRSADELENLILHQN
ncbi:nucleolar protein 4-like [Neosynchiropus ocellatus]